MYRYMIFYQLINQRQYKQDKVPTMIKRKISEKKVLNNLKWLIESQKNLKKGNFEIPTNYYSVVINSWIRKITPITSNLIWDQFRKAEL